MIIDEKSLKEMCQRSLEEETLKRDNAQEELLKINAQIEEIYRNIAGINNCKEKLNEDEKLVQSLNEEKDTYNIFIKFIGVLLFLGVIFITAKAGIDIKYNIAVGRSIIKTILLAAGAYIGSALFITSLIKSKKSAEKELSDYPSLESIDKKRKQYVDQNTKYHAQLKNLEVEKRRLEEELKEKDYLITLLQGKIELVDELTQQETEREESQTRKRVRN